MKKIGLISLLCLLISACVSNTSVRQHQDYADIAKEVSTVVIIPPDVDIELVAFDGDNEELTEDQLLIAAEITAQAKGKLKSEGLTVIDFDIAGEMLADEEFAYAVTQCTEAWNAAKQELYVTGFVSEEKKSSFQTSMGPVANAIAEKTGADSMLLMHFQGAKKSAGMIAKDVGTSVLVGVLTMGAVIPVQNTEGATLDIALVETAGGRLIWSNRKALPQVSSALAGHALQELPDVTWKNELAAPGPDATNGEMPPEVKTLQ
ncbi:hypothetical protein QWY82_00390 [Simiduia curdlanivorans]|uniref:Lipoprotein n=1 Tax=Simiduia curdlanivorans TaxID=1492769 RepID=A0ABV8V2L9_9GAMM|nr:hypothetical protein [Simiduia curdlanivorans]MDN3637250.1 hypothetical protein [Simiduia curdlanivorans]